MTENASTAHQFDLESQHTVLLITSSTNPPRDHWRWIYVILQVRKLLISSRSANKPAAANGSQPPPHLSSALPYTILSSNTTTSDAQDGESQLTSGTTEILPVSLQISGDVHLIGEDDASTATTDEKLQHKNIAKIIAEKDFESLQKFGCVQGFAEALASDLQNGIPGDEGDMSSRRTGGGAHFTTQAPVEGFFKLLIKSSNNYIIFLLLVAAVLSVGFGIKEEGPSTGWYEGGIIVFVIIILVVAPSIRDFWLQTQESPAMRQNAGAINLEVDVIRGGFSHEVRISDVVSGDIVSLKRGSTVPGDGLCVSGEFFVLDDGTVASINDKKPFLFCGSKVVGGNGRMLVTSVGINTSWGELMNKVANTPNRAHLPAQLDKVSTGTQIIGISISILILVVTFSRFMVEREDGHSGLPDLRGKPTASKEIMSLIEKIVMKPSGRISILMTSLAIFLLGVVEGIPLFVTLAIRYWNKKTLSGKATAQGTLACVAMGSITTICTNKTGVLNLNELKVDKCYIGDEVIETDYVTGIHTHVREALCNGISTPLLTPSPHCNSTEDPLLCCADFNLGMQYEILRHNCTILETKGLSTNEEGSGVLMRKDSPGNEGDMRLHWKGPASTILAMCSHYYDNKGETKVMDEQSILVFNQIIEDMQSKYLKTIAFAYRQTEVRMLEENSLILIALLGVRYSCCRDIVEACQEAGVNIILVSEDNISDLQDIARECGILLNPNRLVIEGKSFRNSNQVNRMDMADKICVMGNSTPSDRLLLVQCLKEKGHVIAMVGVGTNDAPTLKEADVGIAIGTWSNGVARESSDIIIWDKNVSFLVTGAIGCGRCIYYNIQKYIQLELTMNIAWLLITSITTMCLGQSAIAAIQLVWANMIVTLLGGLALLMEPPTEELMKKEPVTQTESLISKPMWRNIISQALYQTAVLVTFQYKGPTIPSISKKVSESIVFNSFVLCQVFNQVNSRELEKKNVFRGIFQNLWFWVAVSAILTLQVGFVEIAHIVVGNARLNWAEWGICLLIGMGSWAIDLAVKCATSFILSTTSISRTITPTTVSESASNLELPLINGSST